ncbi:hypothetical protein [Alkalihalobacillus pseudalcaliphilus]|uniref:hypothetical protein n=1 Tax=Alkalihalobacillus pseudalcaliphilus TaxID=79884 RepID=UPI00064DC6FB|nr:hypothetical protein [Alkalihalobacillus pseudalcaliphilus]KMK74943.1 hypothetical protein AB990_15810 [Alkalihalobacillus pseudalcaliphilus]
MTKELEIFMEYKIKLEHVEEYEQVMSEITTSLERLGAKDVRWFEALDQPGLYVEMFKLPNQELYEKIKQLRQSHSNPTFKKIIPYVVGGENKVHCWAFLRKEF